MPPREAPNHEAIVAYLLLVLKYNDGTVNYHGLAAEAGLASANTAQKKFKAIVEKDGQFKLVGGKVVDNNPDAA